MPHRPTVSALVLAAAAALMLSAHPATMAASAAPAAAAAKGLPSTTLPWVSAASDAEIDAAFAHAARQGKPVLLYWGASWCPPCNKLKATLFNRQDFATLARSFVAVHVDGDRPGAQRVSTRFKVTAYPTVVLFTPDRQEITRLPGEVEASQVLAVLQSGLNGGRPAQAVLADALAGKPISAADWRALAFYSWETGDSSLVPKADTASTLARLAAAHAAVPGLDADTATRLWLKALATSDDAPAGTGLKPDAALRQRVAQVLQSPMMVRTHMDMVGGNAPAMVRVLEPEVGPARDALVAQFDAALTRLQADATLSLIDRMIALYGRVMLARLPLPQDAVQVQLPAALAADVRSMIGRADRELRDGYEREAVITFGADVLASAGLWTESEALLKSNMAKSLTPYFMMSQLANNYEQLGRNADALQWYEQSYHRAVGPATRVQWGAGYVNALIQLAPKDTARIEKAVADLLAEAAEDSAAFEGRNARSYRSVATKLATWNADGSKFAVMARLQRQLNGVCAKVPAADGQRTTCRGLLKPTEGKPA